MIVTNYGVFEIRDGSLVLTERAEDVSIEEIQRDTEASFSLAEPVKLLAC